MPRQLLSSLAPPRFVDHNKIKEIGRIVAEIGCPLRLRSRIPKGTRRPRESGGPGLQAWCLAILDSRLRGNDGGWSGGTAHECLEDRKEQAAVLRHAAAPADFVGFDAHQRILGESGKRVVGLV